MISLSSTTSVLQASLIQSKSAKNKKQKKNAHVDTLKQPCMVKAG